MESRGYQWYNNTLERKTKNTEVIYEIDDEGDVLIELKDNNQCIHTILHKDKLLEIADYIRKWSK